ncbi:hypothetical protein Cni_G22869 [Canna indica]|uniref:SHSP domain-containing protein n=1 Tax=Canna indica TaxID=4628 RepID=A0AAQ3KT50_9LILI|nr:hypothetical protein Cni_G22869 [Canna indica]
MALARACLKNALRSRSFPLPYAAAAHLREAVAPSSFPFSSTAAADDTSQQDKGAQVEVTQGGSGGKSSSLTGRGRGRRGLSWKNPWDLIPLHLNDGLGNALMQASENMNRLLENWSPSRLLGRLKEDDKCYKLRYEVPGLRKEDLQVTVEDGMLVIKGEAEDEDMVEEDTSTTESEEEGGGWYARRYGYYNATLMLPEDAKADEITAELRDGVLRICIPRTEEKKSKAREIEIK